MLTRYIFIIDPRAITLGMDSLNIINDYQFDINSTDKSGVGEPYEYIIFNYLI